MLAPAASLSCARTRAAPRHASSSACRVRGWRAPCKGFHDGCAVLWSGSRALSGGRKVDWMTQVELTGLPQPAVGGLQQGWLRGGARRCSTQATRLRTLLRAVGSRPANLTEGSAPPPEWHTEQAAQQHPKYHCWPESTLLSFMTPACTRHSPRADAPLPYGALRPSVHSP